MGVEVEDDQSALVEVFFRGVIFGDGIVDIQLSAADSFALQRLHGGVGCADIVVRDHDETSMFTLGVGGADFAEWRKQGTELFVLDVAVDVSHEEGTRGVLAVGVLRILYRATAWTRADGLGSG